MTACIERKELSKAAISAVHRAYEVKDQFSQLTTQEDGARSFDAELAKARSVERQAVLTLATHRKQHGC
jgi:hypothetical protein